MASVLQAQSTEDPIREVLHGFGGRRAALDNVFFKFNIPERGMALLIDFTVRRRQRRRVVEIRASLFNGSNATVKVASFPFSTLRHDDGGYTVGNAWLGPEGSRGSFNAISWDLVFQASGPLLDPQVVGDVRPFDLRLRSVPDALISGNISIDGHGYTFSHEPGTIGTYYGRRLPERLYWVSANAFDIPGVTLECMSLRSSIFGLPLLRAQVGYFHLKTPTSSLTIMHPLTGQIQISGDRQNWEIHARPRHGPPVTIRCAAPETQYQHLGDHLYTTLLGSCTIEGLAVTEGLAALTARTPEHLSLR